jgi:two-component sensor histidine kinase
MAAKPKVKRASLPPSSGWLEHAPSPMAAVEGATHIVREVNPAFCRLFGKAREQILGTPFCDLAPEQDECLALLDRVYRTGEPASQLGQAQTPLSPAFPSCVVWPVMADGRTAGVMIQVIADGPRYEKTLAMNEALMLSSLRQHELTASANLSNVQLTTEIVERRQGELDAFMLTKEISHRIKNNLQIVVALIVNEIKRIPPEYARGYIAMEARIAAIAELYDLMSQSSRGRTVPLDAYLREIAISMSASLLGEGSGISIEVEAEALEIDPDRAVPLGLLVNELGTNAIKHAFPSGTGRVTLSAVRVGDYIELTVADNGVGMTTPDQALRSGKHGSDYVAIFVRQLGGAISVLGSPGTGTTIRVRLPVLAVPSPTVRPTLAA